MLGVVLLAGIAACTADPTPQPSPQAAEQPVPPPAPTNPVTPPDDDPDGDAPAAEDPPATRETCNEDLRTVLTAVVDDQLDAIVARDWARALDAASDSFRAGVDVDGFERIILDGFPVVADASARDVGQCVMAAGQATLTVTVEDSDATQQSLLYLMELDGDRWGIAGAVPTDDDRAPGTTTDPDEPTISA